MLENALDYEGLKYYDEKSKGYIEEKVTYLQEQIDNIPTSGGGSNVNIIDNLETADSESALSANQGKILNDKIETIETQSVVGQYDEETGTMKLEFNVPAQGIIEDTLESTNSYNALSANQGRVLNEKIDNKVNKSGDTITGDLTVEGQSVLGDIYTDSKNVYLQQGYKVHDFGSYTDKDGYVKFASIAIMGASQSGTSLQLSISGRFNIGSIVVMYNTDANNTTITSLRVVQKGCASDFYVVNNGNSVLDLYAYKSKNDHYTVSSIECSAYLKDRINITWCNEFVETVPENAILVEHLHSDETTDYSVKSLTTTGMIKSGSEVLLPAGRYTGEVGEDQISAPASGFIQRDQPILDYLHHYKSFIGSIYDPIVDGQPQMWHNFISVRHRNGMSDGDIYGMYLRSGLVYDSALVWNQQCAGTWGNERIIVDTVRHNAEAGTLNLTIPNGHCYIFVAYGHNNGTSHAYLLVPNSGRASVQTYLQPLYQYNHGGSSMEATISGTTLSVTSTHAFTYIMTRLIR